MKVSTLVYIPGVEWETVQGTDRHLARALAGVVPVLWADPPAPRRALGLARNAPEGRRPVQVQPGLLRLRSVAPPFTTRPLIRSWAWSRMAGRLSAAVAGTEDHVIVLANPQGHFPSRLPGLRVYYLTDDWVAGASLMGLSGRWLRSKQRQNIAAADLVLCVSPDLAARLEAQYAVPVRSLPNGCTPRRVSEVHSAPVDLGLPPPVAGMVGQLNERLDLDVLEAVAERGVNLVAVGPRTERSAWTTHRLDALFRRDNVRWLGPVSPAELAGCLDAMAVGLTPYTDSLFNRSSFPLKTLEYLAAGLPVVASDLPAVRWLDTDLVDIARTARQFADRVMTRLATPRAPGDADRRRAFADQHSWEARAGQLLDLVAASRADSHRGTVERTGGW